MTTTKDKVFDAAGTAKPYVDRALRDEELRESVKNAAIAARAILEELTGRRGVKGIATKVAADRDMQDNLRTAIDELRNASTRLQGKQTEHRGRRRSMLLLIGIALGILFNPVTGPETRTWLKKTLFGSDEFGYPPSPENGSTLSPL